MNVIVDGIAFSLQRHGGVSVYFKQLLSRMARDHVATTLTLHGALLQQAPVDSTALAVAHRPSRRLERYRRCRIPQALSRSGSAVFHSSYYRRPLPNTVPSVVTVHDFTYERFVKGLRRLVHSTQKFAAIRAARAVICVSESTRDDLLEFVGTKPEQTVYVVHNGVDEGFTPIETTAPPRPFVLFVGERGGYKNFALAVRAMAHLPELELCCVGGGPFEAGELDVVDQATQARVRHLGFVTDAQLNLLYNQASCLVYPSLYEGFGIPVIEAMRSGCPVISVPCKAVLEIGGAALTVVAENDLRAMADAVRCVSDIERRTAIKQAGFAVARAYSWERTYRQTLQIYRVCAGSQAPRHEVA